MPVLPYLEDDPGNIRQIVQKAAKSGASYIIPAFGLSLRPGSRDYYYQKLDEHFPGLKEKYIHQFGEKYNCSAPNWQELNEVFTEEIKTYRIQSRIPVFKPVKRNQDNSQIPLFSN